ncbi:uncharacterized protein LOC125669602 [Ostrea edulis]|uniref:uncharacterized protein LOC125669602 n=1 Tax=Ostrea edulis TaxID=37623 RepID=UPI00209439ED|nr:uncharacterized protein LOC125669602 [Ostrea edulis]XP_056020276.1 uncharacterized protein LOC125669602 [Ostrea edulis]
MAEVSHIRNAANRTRPLGDVKDDIAYMVDQDSRYASRDDYNNDIGDVQKMKDVKESIRHAALINIVAAVNDSCDDESSNSHLLEHSQRSTDSGMTLLSNLMFSKDRSISIPKPQVFFQPPERLSTKKPVFYKNSKDEVQEDIEHRKRCVSLTRTRMTVDEDAEKALTDRPKSERIQFSVSIQPLQDDIKSNPPNPPWIEKPSKVKNARSMSPRRRFVSLNKKIDTKTGTVISKCEAVDIMDATECVQNRLKPPPISHIESYGEQTDNAENDPSLYRARSLPSLFPVKKKKEVKVSEKNGNGSDKDKAKLISPFKRPSATAYGCLPNMVTGKTMQTKSDNNESNLVQEQKLYHRVEKMSSAIKETISKFETHTDPPKPEGVVISLEGHSIPNPRNSNTPGSSKLREKRLLNRPLTRPDYMKMNSAQERNILRDLDHHFDELHRTLAQRNGHWSDNTSQTTTYDITNYGLVGKKFKSKNSEKVPYEKTKPIAQKIGVKPKSTKRVTFAPVESSVNSEIRSTTNSLCEERQDSSRTKRAINQVNNARTGSSSMKAVSSGELSRLKRRIIPEQFDSDHKPKYDLLDNIRISGMSSRESSIPPRPPSRMSDIRSMVSEGASSYLDEVAFDWNDRETDAADRVSSSVPKSYGASSFYPDNSKIKLNFNHYQYSDSEESSDEEDPSEMYRIVKAVDLGTLSGYQHRKFRKPPTTLETSTTHFVKIKVK